MRYIDGAVFLWCFCGFCLPVRSSWDWVKSGQVRLSLVVVIVVKNIEYKKLF